MAKIVLDKCIIKPSNNEEYEEEILFEMSNSIKIPKNYCLSKNLCPKSIKFNLMKRREINQNLNATVSCCDGRESLIEPLYNINCDCVDHRKLEILNFEFITDSFYDDNHSKISKRRLKDHPLYLMVNRAINNKKNIFT